MSELWFIPAQTPPHKPAVASAEQRAQMLLLATLSNPAFRVSRLELERSGPSYTFDTVARVKAERPDATLFFITGADAYADIASWHRARELVDQVHMVAVARPGYTLEGVEATFREHVRSLETRLCDISSTDIRTVCGGSRVYATLFQNLWRPTLTEPLFTVNSPCTRASIAPYCARVKERVSSKRFEHIVRVAILSETIAQANRFSESEVRAVGLAATLHDVARDLSAEELFKLAPPETELERQHPTECSRSGRTAHHRKLGRHRRTRFRGCRRPRVRRVARQPRGDGGLYR